MSTHNGDVKNVAIGVFLEPLFSVENNAFQMIRHLLRIILLLITFFCYVQQYHFFMFLL